jgi:alpha-L-arabinofuranosidase
MRQVDPNLDLVVCGSSSATMPTFGEWERVVLMHTYEDVDFISCHAYYEEKDGDIGSFLASATSMDNFIESVVATADHVKAVRKSTKTINISFDEWNVWYLSKVPAGLAKRIDDWPVAPPISEEAYTVADGVVVGSLLMSLIRHADRVTSASIAQLVNVIAPIAAEPRGRAWRKSTFFPFATTSRLARGVALHVDIDGPTYGTAEYGEVPVVDAAATLDTDARAAAIFLVNRSPVEEVEVSLDIAAMEWSTIAEALTLSEADPHAANTSDRQDRVRLRPPPRAAVAEGTLRVTLPPVSWTAVSLR